jgi:hypothetical protein
LYPEATPELKALFIWCRLRVFHVPFYIFPRIKLPNTSRHAFQITVYEHSQAIYELRKQSYCKECPHKADSHSAGHEIPGCYVTCVFILVFTKSRVRIPGYFEPLLLQVAYRSGCHIRMSPSAGCTAKMHALLIRIMRATQFTHHIVLDLVTQIIL